VIHPSSRARHATRLGAILVLLAVIGAERSGRASQGLPAYQEILLPGNAFAGVVRGPGGGLYGVTYEGGLNNLGTIFVASNDLSQVTTLWHFNGTDGSVPYAELTVGGSTLYGTTSRGGASGAGTVFKFEGGMLTTLASFGSGGLSSPMLLLGGYLYGSTSSFPGGSSIFRVPTSGGDPEFLHFFSVAADGSAPDGLAPGALTLGPDGLLYGTALYGGDPACYPAPYSGCGTIFRLRPEPDPNGFEVIYTFRPPPPPPPPPPGEEVEAPAPPVTFPQRKIVIGSDGRLYGTTFAIVFGLPLDGGNPDGSDLQTLHRIPKFSSKGSMGASTSPSIPGASTAPVRCLRSRRMERIRTCRSITRSRLTTAVATAHTASCSRTPRVRSSAPPNTASHHPVTTEWFSRFAGRTWRPSRRRQRRRQPRPAGPTASRR
jgi:uncharacterized repeat protein (TIGR03803 family)